MWIRGSILVVAMAAIATTMAAGSSAQTAEHPAAPALLASAATPPGITLQAIQPIGPTPQFYLAEPPDNGTAYADADGMTLYLQETAPKPGEAMVCGGPCEDWKPALAPQDAKPVGDWTVLQGQWAYRGRPLYTYAKDAGVGDNKGEAVEGGHWRLAWFQLADHIASPADIGVREVPDANATVLVDERRLTLYSFQGDVTKDRQACASSGCSDLWIPVEAPQIAGSIGDFSVVTRADGRKQWAYLGRGLYRYKADSKPGDARGIEQSPHWQVAAVARYFMPPDARILQTAGRGGVLATGAGKTLYRRDTSYHNPSGRGLPHSVPGNPTWGRITGTRGCAGECLNLWQPFLAPADAKPSGYWSIYLREDGSRQWAYRGYALYTHQGDTKPGDLTGTQIYDLLATDDLSVDISATGVVPTTGAAALYWAYAEP